MKKGTVKFIPKHQTQICWGCKGTGTKDEQDCLFCEGTGEWVNTYYYMIAKTPDGQKIAFGVETIK